MVNDKLEEFRLSAKKVELSSFDGYDPVAWVTRAETYFEVQRTSEEVKIQLAKLSVEGHTIHWFSLWRESTKELTWKNLSEALVARFGAGRLDNTFEELKEIKQKGSVEDHIKEFELFSTQCGRLPERHFLGYFVGGLRREIKRRVRTLKPKDRYQAMQLARDIEAELNPDEDDDEHTEGRRGAYGLLSRMSRSVVGLKGNMGLGFNSNMAQNTTSFASHKLSGFFGYGAHQFGLKTSSGTAGGTTSGMSARSSSSTAQTVRRGREQTGEPLASMIVAQNIPYAELMERKSKGLCFRYGEKYSPLHRCADPQLRLLVLGEDKRIDEEGVVFAVETEETQEEQLMECKLVSLCGILGEEEGRLGPRTMKLTRIIAGVPLVVLVDSGASHFISPTVVSVLGLEMDCPQVLGVKLGDGHKVHTLGKCSEIKMKLGEV